MGGKGKEKCRKGKGKGAREGDDEWIGGWRGL